MGKKMIIKGADFSVNGMPGSEIIWQELEALDDVSFNEIKSSAAALGVGLKLTTALDKAINVITFKIAASVSTSITYSIFKAKNGDSLSDSFTSLKDFSITNADKAAGYKRVVLDSSVVITDDTETLMVGVLNNATSDVSIPVAYQTHSGHTHQYLIGRSSTIDNADNAAYFIMKYGKV